MKPMDIKELKENYEWQLDKAVSIIRDPNYRTKVYGRYTHASESGMTRWMTFYMVWDKELHSITGLIAAVLGEQIYAKGRQNGIKRAGCGYSTLNTWLAFLRRLHALGLINEDEAKYQNIQTLY